MPLGTLDSTPPPFFRQGPSALSKLVLLSALALLLLVADTRFRVVQPLRAAVATALYPLQWLLLRPVVWAQDSGHYLEGLSAAQEREAAAQYQLGRQSQRALQVEQLLLENQRLRALLELRERLKTPTLASQVLYDAADPFSRKVIIDKGSLAAVEPGAPVLDETGVLGQVTRVFPLVSEVTLLTDRNQSIPLLDARSGVRALAFGDSSGNSGLLELRFMDSHADVQSGDLLTTSGIDGVYPPGLPVARVSAIERRADSSFARINAEPLARTAGSLHLLVLQNQSDELPPRPPEAQASSNGKKGTKP